MQNKASYRLSEHPVGIDVMRYRNTLTNNEQQERLPFVTATSVAKRRRTLSHRKSPTCRKSSQGWKSSKTSAVVSISNAKDSRGYWNDSCAVINSELWAPIGIDSHDSAAKSFGSWSNKTVATSWFSTKLHTVPKRNGLPICWRYATSFPHGDKALPISVTKSRKIRIYPTVEQKAILRRWEGISRYVFNETVKELNKGQKVYAPDLLKSLPEWTTQCPRHIRVGAVMDAQKAVTAARRKWKETGEPQRVKFRRKRNNTKSFYLCAQFIKSNGFYVRLLGDMKMTEPLPAKPQGKGKKAERNHEAEVKDSRVVMENDRFYLNVSYIEKTKPRDSSGDIVALDPGVRTFMTCFSEKAFGWIGTEAINRIQRLCQHADNLYSRATQVPRPLRRTLRKCAQKIQKKIQNLVDELHKKVAHFLVTNYDVILLPTFETSQMTRRGARKIRKKSVRQMLTLSHYQFKIFLKQKAQEYGVTVVDANEAYTSKTLSWTGDIVENLGGAKVITDEHGNRCDRDLNGARGIFIAEVARALRVLPST